MKHLKEPGTSLGRRQSIGLMMDQGPWEASITSNPGLVRGNEPHMHKLVAGMIVVTRVPFAISCSTQPLMQIEWNATDPSGAKWDTEIDKNKALSWIWSVLTRDIPFKEKSQQKRKTVISILIFSDIAKVILKLLWNGKYTEIETDSDTERDGLIKLGERRESRKTERI